MTDDHDRTPGTASGGTAEFNQPASQAERRKMLRNDLMVQDGYIGGRPATSTFFAEAGLDDDEIAGGRFSPKKGPDPWPTLPPDSPWAGDPVPIEPPYGDRVDWLPDQLTVSGEDQRNLTPWQFGEWPTEQHSAYDLDPNSAPASAAGCTSLGGPFLPPENAAGSRTISAPVETAALPSSETPQPKPMEPTDATTEET